MDPPVGSTLEDFERYDVASLKDYLARHGISQKDNKAELAALAYACHVMNKPTTNTFAQNTKEAFKDYQDILHLPNHVSIPDPFKVKNGWIDEEGDGMKLWPPISIADIIDYFREQRVHSDKLLSEYKAGKAYDYFKTEWLKEIFYNCMDDYASSYQGVDKYCLLKAKCTPSQRINDPYHYVWVVVEKDCGKVAVGYCNSAAGLSQTCNHVAAMLF